MSNGNSGAGAVLGQFCVARLISDCESCGHNWEGRWVVEACSHDVAKMLVIILADAVSRKRVGYWWEVDIINRYESH